MRKLLIILLLVSSVSVYSQEKDLTNVSIDGLLGETQFSNDHPDAMELVWWIPTEFWEISFLQDGSSSEADIQALKALFEGYELFAIVKGKIGYFGGITYEPLEAILKELKVRYKNTDLKPVQKEEIPSDLLNFLSAMQPMMANLFGTMGENMHFVLMQDSSSKTVLPIKATGNDNLTITLADFTKEVDLPLSKLLKEKVCPVDNAMHSGKWHFCPFHGKELIAQ
ncbi:hypothetical protein [Marixanthomonas spongiae]|uniref:Uncharacterized protein n=1 Tax=Marixanthomonas spongiae TaxID=2174845 RepID=A0A2U0HZC6_9FLAO|nr:hypothetical protein [Marixanthomonas spongiae]PVW14188.1 hypothetical protein DDV96_10260 [Marixanthomonas spongiae]